MNLLNNLLASPFSLIRIILTTVLLLSVPTLFTSQTYASQDGGAATASLGGVSVADGGLPNCIQWNISDTTADNSVVTVALTVTNGMLINGNSAQITLSVPGVPAKTITVQALVGAAQVPISVQTNIATGQSVVATVTVTTSANNVQACNDTKTATIKHPSTPPPGSNQAGRLSDFDKNGNGSIENGEFFAAVDQWIAGSVSDSLFFIVVDSWISGGSAPGNPTPPTSGPEPMCPTNSRLVALQNGVPFVNPFQMPDGFLTGLDIAFNSDVYLPRGTTVNLNITSDRAGLSPTEVFIGPPFTQASITQLGELQVLGIATIRDGANVPRNHEWAQFTPMFSSGETFGNIGLAASFKAPGCPEVKMGGSVRVSNPAASALSLVKTMVTGNSLSLSTSSDDLIQVELFDLSGKLNYTSHFANSITLDSGALGRELSNGVYLYVVRLKTASGEITQSEVRKVALLR
jgi:hypothetical protein